MNKLSFALMKLSKPKHNLPIGLDNFIKAKDNLCDRLNNFIKAKLNFIFRWPSGAQALEVLAKP
ncbi:MAG TPA: hypothetical protein VF627_03130 [Abditibacterium sp.]